MPLPRKFLNEDEELLAELRPHWIFLFGPLFSSIAIWVVIIVLVVLWHNPPGWTNYPFIIIALIPGLWLLGRYVRWRSYDVALTSTRILVRQGIFGRDTVQLRLQRITEVNIRQELIERLLGTGSLIIDVQGEDDSMTLEYMRKPAIVQRVINSQINEIVGGGQREPIPEYMLPFDERRAARHDHGADHADTDHGDTAPPRHHLRGGVRRQEERAAEPHLGARRGPGNDLQTAGRRGRIARPLSEEERQCMQSWSTSRSPIWTQRGRGSSSSSPPSRRRRASWRPGG
ncbi:MAG: PH domain-containing protein [Acidimicrobiales bacterium]